MLSRVTAALALTCALAPSAFAQDYQAEFDAQWGLRMIGVDKALAKGLDGRGVLVGVQDSGLDVFHPEFGGRLGPLSYDAFTNGPVFFDPVGHGTHVAGIIAARRDGFGMHGVASGATIVPLRIGDPWTWSFQARDTLRYGLANGVRLFNASWGTTGTYDMATPWDFAVGSAPEIEGFREVVAAGGVMVFANGNQGNTLPLSFQAALPYYLPELQRGWLAVASVGPTAELAYYSQQCSVARLWCLAAPGGDLSYGPAGGIYSSVPVSDYDIYQGTSMAAPHVTGAMAIGAQLYSNASMQDIAALVLQTATDIGAPGIDDLYGWGLLNVGNMVDTFDPAAGSIHAQQLWSRSATLDRVMDAVSARDVTVDQATPYGWWLSPFAGTGTVGQSGSPLASDFSTAGVAGGVEFSITPELAAGLFVASTHASLRSGQGNTADDASLHGGVTLSYDNAAVFADLALGASRFWGSSRRVTAPGLNGTVLGAGAFNVSSSTEHSALWGDATMGYRFDMGVVEIAPYAFGRANHQMLGSFAETGNSVLTLSGGSTSLTTGEIGFGVQLTGTPMALNNLAITPSLDIAYGHRIGDDFTRTVNLMGNAMTASEPVGRDVLHIGAKLDISANDAPVNVQLGYGGAFSQGASTHAVTATVSGRF